MKKILILLACLVLLFNSYSYAESVIYIEETKSPGVKVPQEPYFLGDLNGDGRITSADHAILYRVVLGAMSINNNILKSGDFSGDGRITTSDEVLFRRIIIYT